MKRRQGNELCVQSALTGSGLLTARLYNPSPDLPAPASAGHRLPGSACALQFFLSFGFHYFDALERFVRHSAVILVIGVFWFVYGLGKINSQRFRRNFRNEVGSRRCVLVYLVA